MCRKPDVERMLLPGFYRLPLFAKTQRIFACVVCERRPALVRYDTIRKWSFVIALLSAADQVVGHFCR
jgi:hypothetical protein